MNASPSSGSAADPSFQDARSTGWAGQPALLVGMGVWLAIMILYWPTALSFGDDVGYLGEARVLLAGHVRPRVGDIGVWVASAHGRLPKYPLLFSLLLLPLVAATPKAAFALGMAAAVGTAWLGGRILRSWGKNPVWALLLIAHPTVVLLARTVMADLPLTVFAIGAWWASRQHRRVATVVFFTGLLAIKATGFVVGLALASGELLRLLPNLRRRERDAWSRVGTIAIGLLAGFALLFVTNEISAGGPWFAYDNSFLGTPPFWITYFAKSAPAHLRTVLLLPPLLIAGALPFWRRREWGPLCLIFGFGTLMCFYFFVDTGTTRLESLILAPRLVLPIVSFLLIGYADLLATAAGRLGLDERFIAPALIAGTAAVALVIGLRHHAWQSPMADALQTAQAVTRDLDVHDLGVTPEAVKAGIMFPGTVRLAEPGLSQSKVVLCSLRSASYRQPNDGPHSCNWPGYREYRRVGDYEILVRQPRTSGTSP